MFSSASDIIGAVLNNHYTIRHVFPGVGTGASRYLTSGRGTTLYYCCDQGPQEAADCSAYRTALEAAKSLSHPHLAPIVDSFCAAGREYIVVEAVPGASLAEVILAPVAPSRRRIHALLHQLCMVLAYVEGLQPAFIFDTLEPDEIQVDAAGHIRIDQYRLGRSSNPEAIPAFSTSMQARSHNYRLLARLIEYVMLQSRRGVAQSRGLDSRAQALVRRLEGVAGTPGYTFQEASRSLGAALGTGILLTGDLTEPRRARRATEELYATRAVYTGVDRDGRVLTGELQSDTLQEAVQKLRSRGLKVEEVRFETGLDRFRARFKRLPPGVVALVFVATCVAGGWYTFKHRTDNGPVPQHAKVFVAGADRTLLTVDVRSRRVRLVGTLAGAVAAIKVLAGGTVVALLDAHTHGLSFVRGDTAASIPVKHPFLEPLDKLLLSPHRDILYGIERNSGTIAVLSVTGLALNYTFKTPSPIGDVAIAEDGRLLYVSVPRLNSVYVLDAVRGMRRSILAVAGGPEVLGLCRPGELWTASGSGVMRRVPLDVRHEAVVTTSEVDGHVVGFAHQGPRTAYILSDTGMVMAIAGDNQSTVLAMDGPGSMAWTQGPTGDLWVSNGRDEELHVLAPGSHPPDSRIQLPCRPVALDLAP